jgi:uncharacterized protein (DUF924 family)
MTAAPAAAEPPAAQAVLDFWFGPPPLASRDPWFRKDPAFDESIRARFGGLVDQTLAGPLGWGPDPRARLAEILVLDQFPRNLFRDSPRAFSGDPRALALAQDHIAAGHHRRLPAIHQAFLFMPLEHSEDLDAQEECVTLFRELEGVTGLPLLGDFLRYAEAHRDVIARFGRFPHRNALLGRESTPEELDYLRRHGGF